MAAWIAHRGGVGNRERHRRLLPRFDELSSPTAEQNQPREPTEPIKRTSPGKTINRAGSTSNRRRQKPEYFILPEAYKTEIWSGNEPGSGHEDSSSSRVAGNVKLCKSPRPRRPAPKKVCHLKADIMGESVAQTEKRRQMGDSFAVELVAKYGSL